MFDYEVVVVVVVVGVYLVAEPADRYPGDDDGGISDLSGESRIISHLGSWEEDRMGKNKFKFIATRYSFLSRCCVSLNTDWW